MNATLVSSVARQLQAGHIIPYLGPGMLALCDGEKVPSTPAELVQVMTAKVSVPHKIRNKLTQAAQYIENFKHRKSLLQSMDLAFTPVPSPSALHLALAGCTVPFWVDTWYDDTLLKALEQIRPQGGWRQIQGLSQAEHFGVWTADYDAQRQPLEAPLAPQEALLYRPIGGRSPASNYLVSDSDYVEVLTEIDIQTPIPAVVQERRKGAEFLFMGCRFDDQLTRSFARQIMKRSSDKHWAVMPDEPTRMEARFLEEQGIERIALSLSDFGAQLMELLQPVTA